MIEKLLNDLGYDVIEDNTMLSLQEEWMQWYQGFVKDFHEYVNYQGTNARHKRKRYSLGMAKTVSELWADNMYNPETTIEIGDDLAQEWWDRKRQEIKFDSNFNWIQELTFALGTTATVQYYDGEVADVDYLTYDKIYPLEVRNGEVISCAFVSQYDDNSIYLNIHENVSGDNYIIHNLFFREKDDRFERFEIEGVEEMFSSTKKLFQIHKPVIVNNKSIHSPFGLSIFANAIEELKSVDLAYDALTKEVEYGKIRVYLRSGAFDIDFDDGKTITVINPNQEEFYLLAGEDIDEGEQVTVSAPQLREVLIDFLNTQLNLLGRKVGLGDNAFSFDEGTIYTNTTQVISTNSKFYKTRQKHGVVMEENIIDMIKALYLLEFDRELEAPISVHMDDSIIYDKEDSLNRALQLNREGIVSDEYVVMEYLGMTEEEAIEFLKRQKELMGNEEYYDEE